jgi:hypothetical protein
VVGARSDATELSGPAGLASLGAALLLLFCALRAPPKNWLLDYYPNPTFAGESTTRAWVRRVNFEVPKDVLLRRVPERPDFSVRFQSCLPLSDPTDVAVRLTADDRASLYVDGGLVIDSSEPVSIDEVQRHERRPTRAKGKQHLALQPGSHLITVEYSNSGGSGTLRLELSEPGLRDDRLQSRLRRPSLDGRCDSI